MTSILPLKMKTEESLKQKKKKDLMIYKTLSINYNKKSESKILFLFKKNLKL